MSDSKIRNLGSRIPSGGTDDPDQILELFLEWTMDTGFELYPAQEEALLEIMAGRHVILSTPTGSGKSLVAIGMHFKAMCEGKISYYTSPIKALASEKFFSLCNDFGPDNVGMLTGDASINPEAPLLCCTAEVLSNMALRLGNELAAHYVIMDEFHYYADPDRGVAWQVPLITLPATRFLLMSATLGDMSVIARQLEQQTAVTVAEVCSDQRPVPLDYDYRETPLHETVQEIVDSGRAPVYLVNFTQRDCAEVAQSLTSMQLTSKEERAAIRDALGNTRFSTPYGREFKRFLSFGIGVHHAGLLPRYRLQVEKLAQRGLLKVVSGTDTLGVGVNIPIRTVLFTKLAKFDGHKVTLLKVRDFKQISGRAGRMGFDDRGSVVCQAPEHIIENKKAAAKAAAKPGKKKGPSKKAREGEVSWSEDTFKNLIERPPERLQSRFKITNGMILDLVQRDARSNDPDADNFHALRQLIARCHEDETAKGEFLAQAAVRVRSLYRLGILRMTPDTSSAYKWVMVNDELQVDFSLFHNLSLFLVEAITRLEPASPEFALDLLSLVEAVLEDPVVVLRKQVDLLKTELIAELKAEGVSYEERIARLDEVTHPQPCADFIHGAFDRFAAAHPWVGGAMIRPKSIAREMIEGYLDFSDYVKRYGLQRSEGVLIRYLSQVYKTLDQNVPDWAKDDGVWDVAGFLRAMLERVDSSLIEEWEGLRHPELRLSTAADPRAAHRHLVAEELVADERKLRARVRAELHALVRELAAGEWEEAAECVRTLRDDPDTQWSAERFTEALAPFLQRYGQLVFDHSARLSDTTQLKRRSATHWDAIQILVDPEQDNLWCIEAVVDLAEIESLDGPIIAVKSIGS